MDEVTTLLSRYSIESIIIFVIIGAVAVKFLGELLDWFSNRLRNYFNMKDDEKEFKDDIKSTLKKIEDQQMTESDKIDTLQLSINLLQDRMQDSTRAYIIDKYHHFVRLNAIDDMSLNDLERRFMYYKDAGGDTFIDTLMEDIRVLPRLSVEQLQEKQAEELKEGGKV